MTSADILAELGGLRPYTHRDTLEARYLGEIAYQLAVLNEHRSATDAQIDAVFQGTKHSQHEPEKTRQAIQNLINAAKTMFACFPHHTRIYEMIILSNCIEAAEAALNPWTKEAPGAANVKPAAQERPMANAARLRRIHDIATRLLAEPPSSTDTADLIEICDQVEQILGTSNPLRKEPNQTKKDDYPELMGS